MQPKFLGVSPQTVYLWVERKQIPHLRVMGRNIRFLKSDLEASSALGSNRRWRMSRPIQSDGRVIRRKKSRFWWMYYRERDGTRRKRSTFTEDWNEANQKLRERLHARDGNILQVVRKGETLTFRGVGRFVLRKLFQTTHSRTENTCS